MAKSPLSCCLSASLVFEVQCIENEQGETLRSWQFGEVQVGLHVGSLQGGTSSLLLPAEARGINRASPQPLSNPAHWAGSHLGHFACSGTFDHREQKDSILVEENVRKCCRAILFFTDFTDEEPEAEIREGLVLWSHTGGTGSVVGREHKGVGPWVSPSHWKLILDPGPARPRAPPTASEGGG